jgi:hypothetical protein
MNLVNGPSNFRMTVSFLRRTRRLGVTDSWLTDGNWAIKRSRLGRLGRALSKEMCEWILGGNGHVLDHLTDESMAKLSEKGGIELARTGISLPLVTSKNTATLFMADNHRYAWLDRRFVEAFDIQSIVTCGHKRVCEAHEGDLLVMPVLVDPVAGLSLVKPTDWYAGAELAK